MDKTETYIKMCDCPEIQEIFKGFDLTKFPNYAYDKVTERVSIIFWTPNRLKRMTCNKGNVLIVSIESDREKNQYVPEYEGDFCDSIVWLPRQDQLQEMIWDKLWTYCSNKVSSLSWGVYDFYLHNEESPIPDSMEQLWLAFYMYEKHSKYWTRQGWSLFKDGTIATGSGSEF